MNDNEVQIEESPLSQRLMKDGFEVEIHIYRIAGSKDGWTLEVVDEEGASTVWDEPFDTDQEARDEVMRTIEEEGIATFLQPSGKEMH